MGDSICPKLKLITKERWKWRHREREGGETGRQADIWAETERVGGRWERGVKQ